MDIKLDFNPEEIAQKMSEAIISSSFKSMFENAVKEEIQRIDKSTWNANSIVESVIRKFINQCMEEVLTKDYEKVIKDKLVEKIKGEKLDSLLDEFVSKISIRNY